MKTQDTKTAIPANSAAMDRGRRMCRHAVKQAFGSYTWVFANLPGDQHSAIQSLLNLVVRCMDYLDLESSNGLSLDVWNEFRDELGSAFQDRYESADMIPLIADCRKFNVPRQFLFDMLDAVDLWIRKRGFESWDELSVFSSRMGGSAMAIAVYIAGFVQEGFENAALQAGQSIMLTNIIENMVNDLKLGRNFLARQDIEETGISLSHIKVRKPDQGVKHLVRLYGARIEKLMYAGGKLADYLDYDARRSFTSLMAIHFEKLTRLRLQPELILANDGKFARRTMFLLKGKHILGIEGNVPVIPAHDPHH